MDYNAMIGMGECPVCAAFPDHKGKHYTLREIHARFRYARLRSFGKANWVELDGCESVNGYPIVAAARMTNHPASHNVAPGCTLCERTPDFNPDEEMLPEVMADTEVVAPTLETGDEQPVAELDSPAPGPVKQSRKEVNYVAGSGCKGYTVWKADGLQVEIRSVHNGVERPDVTELKRALTGLAPSGDVLVTVTETLGDGDAWVTLAAQPGAQADLLISAGMAVAHLVNAGAHEEVLLAGVN